MQEITKWVNLIAAIIAVACAGYMVIKSFGGSFDNFVLHVAAVYALLAQASAWTNKQ